MARSRESREAPDAQPVTEAPPAEEATPVDPAEEGNALTAPAEPLLLAEDYIRTTARREQGVAFLMTERVSGKHPRRLTKAEWDIVYSKWASRPR